MPAVVVRYFEAINTENWGLLADVYAQDAVVHPPGGDPVRGRAAIIGWYQAVFRRFPDHTDRPLRAVTSADGLAVVVEIAFSGEAAGGRGFRIHAVDIFDLAHDRIQVMRSWLDTAAFATAVSGGDDRATT